MNLSVLILATSLATPTTKCCTWRWQDEVGNESCRTIAEDGLNVAYVDGNTLCLKDTDGLEVRLRLFLMQRVEWDASQDVPLKKDEIGA